MWLSCKFVCWHTIKLEWCRGKCSDSGTNIWQRCSQFLGFLTSYKRCFSRKKVSVFETNWFCPVLNPNTEGQCFQEDLKPISCFVLPATCFCAFLSFCPLLVVWKTHNALRTHRIAKSFWLLLGVQHSNQTFDQEQFCSEMFGDHLFPLFGEVVFSCSKLFVLWTEQKPAEWLAFGHCAKFFRSKIRLVWYAMKGSSKSTQKNVVPARRGSQAFRTIWCVRVPCALACFAFLANWCFFSEHTVRHSGLENAWCHVTMFIATFSSIRSCQFFLV